MGVLLSSPEKVFFYNCLDIKKRKKSPLNGKHYILHCERKSPLPDIEIKKHGTASNLFWNICYTFPDNFNID